jgi:hypothetical protein
MWASLSAEAEFLRTVSNLSSLGEGTTHLCAAFGGLFCGVYSGNSDGCYVGWTAAITTDELTEHPPERDHRSSTRLLKERLAWQSWRDSSESASSDPPNRNPESYK